MAAIIQAKQGTKKIGKKIVKTLLIAILTLSEKLSLIGQQVKKLVFRGACRQFYFAMYLVFLWATIM